MRRALVILAIVLTGCRTTPEEEAIQNQQAEAKRRREALEKIADRQRVIEKRGQRISHRFGLEPFAAQQLAARSDLPDIEEEPFPSLWDRIASTMPVARGSEGPCLAADDVSPLFALAAADEATRSKRLDRLTSDQTRTFAKRLAELYGYVFRLADEPAIEVLATTPAGERAIGPASAAAFAAYLPQRLPTWRFPLVALGPLERLSARTPGSIRSAREKLVAAGIDPIYEFTVDARVVELTAAAAGDDAIARGVEALARRPFAPSTSVLDAPTASLARLGRIEAKALDRGLKDLCHARGFRSIETLDGAALDGAATLIEADATTLLLAIEGPFDVARVKIAFAPRIAALRKRATAAQAHDLMRRAHHAGWEPDEAISEDLVAGAETILGEPRLVVVLEGARTAWTDIRPRTPALKALLPLAACRAPDELFRAAAATGVDIARDPPGIAAALAELDQAPQGRAVLQALLATFPDVRLTRAQDVRRLAALVRKGLAPPTMLSLDKKVQLSGSLDDAVAASIARAAGI
jgi:hypothetical protein